MTLLLRAKTLVDISVDTQVEYTICLNAIIVLISYTCPVL